jgi:glutathione synthase/RimK-type ligase-like ATP-grasp enzyme
MADRLHIGVLAERRYLAQSQPSGLLAALRARGHGVRVIDAQAAAYPMGDDRWLGGLDLIVARGRSWGLLCLLAWAEARGVPTLNRRGAVSAVHNKADMAVALAAGRLPTPRTFLGDPGVLAATVPADCYPLILKPIFGDNCRGLHVAASPAELARLEWGEPVALAQTYRAAGAYDLKLYGIGDTVWAVRKASPFPPRPPGRDEPPAEIVPLTPALTDLGRRCGRLFGLELFGVDCVPTEDGPLVIEVNDFPNYTNVPDADEELADYVVRRARQERTA